MTPTVVFCMRTSVLSYKREQPGVQERGSRRNCNSVLWSAEVQISGNPDLTNSCVCKTPDLVLSPESLKLHLQNINLKTFYFSQNAFVS